MGLMMFSIKQWSVALCSLGASHARISSKRK